MFCNPVIPGPLIKKPNTSLYPASTNSLYSSEAKTYLNVIVLLLDTILNDTMLASNPSSPPVRGASVSEPGRILYIEVLEEMLGPFALATVPVVRSNPLSIPRFAADPHEKLPMILVFDVSGRFDLIFEIVTPLPAND
jgi:hypothetical protein